MSEHDRTEFKRYCKFFTQRVAQIIVQSRLGKKISTENRMLSTGTDWFNLSIEQDTLAEITTHVKSSLQDSYPPTAPFVCIDILLKTADGDRLDLENWCMKFDADLVETIPTSGSVSQIYHRMGILLRSVLCASRVTPTYKYYARRQGADSFIICWQVYSGRPQTHRLGPAPRSVSIGEVVSQFGTVSVVLTYRTEMVIVPTNTHAVEQFANTLRENYYAAGPGEPRPLIVPPDAMSPITPVPDSPSDYVFNTFATSPPHNKENYHPSRSASFTHPTTFYNVPFLGSPSVAVGQVDIMRPRRDSLPATVRFMGSPHHASSLPRGDSVSALLQFRLDLSESGSGMVNTSPKPNSFPGGYRTVPHYPTRRAPRSSIGRGNLAEQSEKSSDDFPFAALLRPTTSAPVMNITSAYAPLRTALNPRISQAATSSNSSFGGLKFIEERAKSGNGSDSDSSDESFVKIDVRPAFAPKELGADLGLFVRECKAAPLQLQSFRAPSVEAVSEEFMTQIPAELDHFQEQSRLFDQFVQGLQEESPEEDTSKEEEEEE